MWIGRRVKILRTTTGICIFSTGMRRKGIFINTTDKGIADRLANAVFGSCKRISGEEVFRCLYGINRLMLSTVGLKTAVSNHHIRYRMFAGVDVAEE